MTAELVVATTSELPTIGVQTGMSSKTPTRRKCEQTRPDVVGPVSHTVENATEYNPVVGTV